MATLKEIDSFVFKFKQLLANGIKASLTLEADRSDATVTLRAGFGLSSCQNHGYGSSTPRKRNQSYIRRQERRKQVRQNRNVRAEQAQSFASSLEAYGMEIVSDDNIHVNAEEAVQMEAGKANQPEVKKEDGEIDDALGNLDEGQSYATFEIAMDVQEQVKSYDIVEAVEENLSGALNNLGVDDNDQTRFILMQNLKQEAYQTEISGNMIGYTYKIIVKNKDVVLDVIKSWKEQNNFDDLAFRNSKIDKKQVKIRDVRKIS